VVGKFRPFHNDIALSKLPEFTNHPMRMCEILGFWEGAVKKIYIWAEWKKVTYFLLHTSTISVAEIRESPYIS
jgi:hypothetical protein